MNNINYVNALILIEQNPYNLQYVDVELIDIYMLRHARKHGGAWAVEGYTPKKLRGNIQIWLDNVGHPYKPGEKLLES